MQTAQQIIDQLSNLEPTTEIHFRIADDYQVLTMTEALFEPTDDEPIAYIWEFSLEPNYIFK